MYSKRLAAQLVCIGMSVAFLACLLQGPPERSKGVPAVLALARPDVVADSYRNWENSHKRADSHASMRVYLSFAKGLSVEPTLATAQIDLDLESGVTTLRVTGFAPEEELEVWLVDNQPGKGRTAMPEDGDDLMRIATVRGSTGSRPLELHLGPDVFRSFAVDLVVIARSGSGPSQGLLFGSPTAFDRLYERARNHTLTGSMDEEIQRLVRLGAELFEREQFGGNGRTCTTCHPAANNLTIDPRFIATLAPDDPLFVAERFPRLADLENSILLRSRGLILENLDGFELPGVLRSVPHTFALATSIRGPEVPFDNTLNPQFGIAPPAERTGWSGDGAPGGGSLREFAIGAVIQHFPLSLERVPGRDFRLPNDEELDALEIFQLALGRAADPDVSQLRFRNAIVAKGRELFNQIDTEDGSVAAGKCALCHNNAGANVDPDFFTAVIGAPISGNANFGTGVNDLGALPSELFDPGGAPRDGGFARVPHDGQNCVPARGGHGTVTPRGGALPEGLCEEDFNTPPLIEAADTAPFFHNNAIDSLEAAISFYNDQAFNESAGGLILASLDTGSVGIRLDSSESSAIGAFLRVMNALENLRSADEMSRAALGNWTKLSAQRLIQAQAEIRDAIRVLAAVGLHSDTIVHLRHAGQHLDRAASSHVRSWRKNAVHDALTEMQFARESMVVDY